MIEIKSALTCKIITENTQFHLKSLVNLSRLNSNNM